jgi:hypothetical protein
MRIKVSINLPWPLATLALALIGGLLAGIALLNYYSYKRINDFEKLTQVSLLNDQRKTQASEAQALLIKQQEEALAQAKIELSASALTSEQVSAKLDELKKNFASQTISSRETVITSADLAPYLTASVQIICVNDKGVGSTGSGTLWKFKEIPYGVITNYHVVKDQKSCVANIANSANKSVGIFALEGAVYTFNTDTDTAVVSLGTSLSENNAPKENYNYAVSALRKCPSSLPVGTPAVLIGFPTFAKRDEKLTIPRFGTIDETYRSVTNGIISGYDTSHTKPRGGLEYQNFFVSAKIDAGNSGGIALAKDDNGICVLGLPTWLSVGTYENQGLIQNITNIIP